MKNHTWAQSHIYEFVKKELSENEQQLMEAHLALCNECKEDVKTITAVLTEIDTSAVDWSTKNSPEYWNNFAFSVQDKIVEDERKSNLIEKFTEWIESFISFRPRDIVIASGFCAIVLVAVIAGKSAFFNSKDQQKAKQSMAQQLVPVIDSEYLRLHDYFRRSKTLLVGIANLKLEDSGQLDIKMEQSMSKGLLHESRQLKQRSLDSRSERLISDMEKILIKVANSESQYNSPELTLIRGGIERENLLYKIRRAEAMYQQPKIMLASNREN